MEIGGGANGSYQISKVESALTEYYVSQTNYKGAFGTKDVLSPQGSGTDRFYVMALNDAVSYTCSWNEANQLAKGQWHVPSIEEWSAFGGQLGITSSNYSDYKLENNYWTSTEARRNYAFRADFSSGEILSSIESSNHFVRLCTTF